jgi:hypothetical protein
MAIVGDVKLGVKGLILLTALPLFGCAHEYWKDISGQHRSMSQLRADNDICRDKATPYDLLDPPQAEIDAEIARLTRCMNEHGWRANP